MYELKNMLKHELRKVVDKGDITPQDLEMIKRATESIYYITAACAMEEGTDDYSGRRYPMYSNDGYSEANRHRDSRGRFSSNSYSGHDIETKRMYLEEMMAEAKNENEREMFRRKLDELNRQPNQW